MCTFHVYSKVTELYIPVYLSQILSPRRFLQILSRFPVLYNRSLLVTYFNTAVCIYMCQSQTPSLSLPPHHSSLISITYFFYLSCFEFFDIELHELVVNFENIPFWSQCLQIFSPILWVVFLFCLWFLCCAKAFEFNFPFIHFCFIYSSRWTEKVIAVIYVRVFCL